MLEKESKIGTIIFTKEPYIYFLNLGLYVCDLLEHCTIFGTTIFLDQRENAPIGENGFLNYSVIFSVLSKIF